MIYPEVLENWWVRYVLRELHCDSLGDCQRLIETKVQTLSDLYTKQREFGEEWFADPALLAAYGLFFFPQTYARTKLVFREMLFRGWKPSDSVSILDLGSGAGAASLAVSSEIQQPLDITAVDRSVSALTIFKNIASDLRLNCEIRVGDIRNRVISEKKQYDLVLASFSLSETKVPTSEWTDLLTKLLKDRGIALILEPSLKETSEELEAWRNDIAQNTPLYIWGPCLHREPCPLLKENKYWCHEVRSWKAPESLAFVNRHLYREIHVLKFSFLAFGKSAPWEVSDFSFRLISPVSKHKKNLMFSGCASDGQKHAFRVHGRSMNEENRAAIRKFERGDILTKEDKGLQILESDHTFVVQNRFSPHHEVTNE